MEYKDIANIAFEEDIDYIKKHFVPDPQAEKLTTVELLIEFLNFYLHVFDHEE